MPTSKFVDHVKSLEPGMVNLDGMDSSDLYKFISATRGMNATRAAGRMFKGEKLATQTVRALHNYAYTKVTAIACRERGEIKSALSYEGTCDRIHRDLPGYAKW